VKVPEKDAKMGNIDGQLIPHYGTAVLGKHRFDRSDINEQICQGVQNGNGIRIFGLRRIGKSTQAKHSLELLAAQGKEIAWVDLQGTNSEAELLFSILSEMPATGIGDKISKALFGDNALSTGVREAIRTFDQGKLGDIEAYFTTVSKIIEKSLLDTESGKLVIAIDEFPWLCRNILESDPEQGRQRVNRLLASLRKWRDNGMRMILLGSIGMTSLGREHQLELDHLNDIPPMTISPFQDPEVADDFVWRLVRGSKIQGWTDEHTENTISQSVALYPSMLQRAFQSLHRYGKAVKPDQIEFIFATTIRPDLDLDFFDQFDRRIKKCSSPTEGWGDAIRQLLARVVQSSDGIERRELQSLVGESIDASDLGQALSALREDGFLDVRINSDGTQVYRIASPLVSAWHRNRQGA